jgi:predicted TPR repeat methyltransferase
LQQAPASVFSIRNTSAAGRRVPDCGFEVLGRRAISREATGLTGPATSIHGALAVGAASVPHPAMPRPKPSKAKAHAWTKGAIERAIARHREGQVTEAAQVYRRVLAVSPQHVDALHFLGLAEHQQGRSEAGLELMSRAVALCPTYADAFVNRGNILKLLGRLDEAEASFRQALAVRPDDANAVNGLGIIQRERGRLDEAASTLRRAIALKPDGADAYENLGNVLASQGRIEEAIQAQEQALRLRPRSGGAYRRLGAILYARGRIPEAADMYRKWLEIEPDNVEARHLLTGCTGGEAPDRAPDELVRRLFDRMARSFDTALARLEYRAPVLVTEAVRAAVGEPAGVLDVLDAGCGTGLCAPMLRPYARRLVGVDLSARMLERARDRGLYDALVEGELTDFLERHADSFDLVVSADTLVYFGALERAAEAAASSLRPGGHLVFTVERSEEGDAPSGHRLHPHGRYSHTERYLRGVLGSAGLEGVEIEPGDLRKEAGRWVRGSLVTARRG